MAKAERLELRLDTELREKLDDLAKLRGIAASVVVRRCILDAHRSAFLDPPAKTRLQPVVRDDPVIIPSGLTEFHSALWGSHPSEVQQRLYTAYGRGYVGTVNEELVDAVITTALHIAPLRAVDLVAILAPADIHTLVMERVRAARMHAVGKPFVASIDETIERMRMGIPPVWWLREPRVWVVVGVAVDETTPAWLRRRLVSGIEAKEGHAAAGASAGGGMALPDVRAELAPSADASHE